MEGCDKLHQGKQGLEALFFCRAHRKIYRDVFHDGEEGHACGGSDAMLVMLGRAS